MSDSARQNTGPYQLFMLLLCLVVLVNLALETFMALPPDVAAILGWMDNAICVLFLIDFAISLARAESAWRYFATWGWIDLLSSVPAVEALRWGRAARVLRILRLLRGVRAARLLSTFVLERRAQSAILAVFFVSILLVAVASISVLEFERGEGVNIHGPEDALWWSIVTMATVGYGDRYPVTTGGRIVGVVLMVGGIALFGTFTGFVGAWFVGKRREEEDEAVAAEEPGGPSAPETALPPGDPALPGVAGASAEHAAVVVRLARIEQLVEGLRHDLASNAPDGTRPPSNDPGARPTC